MEQLSWPVSYDHFNFRGKDYVFFGDYHDLDKNTCTGPCASIDERGNLLNTDSSCWNFDYFMNDLARRIQEAYRYMDVFIEAGFNLDAPTYTINFLGNSYIHKILSSAYIQFCYSKNRSSCIYPNVRFHYTDIRKFINTDNTNILYEFLAYSYEYNMLINRYGGDKYAANEYFNGFLILFSRNDWKKIRDLINIYFDSEDYTGDMIKLYEYLEYHGIYHLYNKPHPIRKQYVKLLKRDPEMAELIRYFITRAISSQINILRDNYTRYIQQEDTRDIYINILKLNLGHINTYIMDTYLLLRLFREFEPNSNLAITYTGMAHSRTYQIFFANILKCKLLSPDEISSPSVQNSYTSTKSPIKQCLSAKYLSDTFHTPIMYDDTVKCLINNTEYIVNKEYVYGIIMAKDDPSFKIEVQIEDRYYPIFLGNVRYVLNVGASYNKFHLANGKYDKIYFNSLDFLRGYISIKPIDTKLFYYSNEVKFTPDFAQVELVDTVALVNINDELTGLSTQTILGIITGIKLLNNTNMIKLTYIDYPYDKLIITNKTNKYFIVINGEKIYFDDEFFLVGLKTAFVNNGKDLPKDLTFTDTLKNITKMIV